MNGWRVLFDREELMPTLKNRLALTRKVKKNNNKSWSKEKSVYHQRTNERTKKPGTQTIFLTTDFDGNSHRHRIEIVLLLLLLRVFVCRCMSIRVFYTYNNSVD